MAQVRTGATIEDLYRVPGKAEIVNGELADAEPALPGWSMPVDDLFKDKPR